VNAALVALAAHRLPGARQPAIADGPLVDREWEQLAGLASAHGLDGLLADAVGRGALAATDAQRASSTRQQVEAMSGCLGLEAALLEALEVLARHRIDAIAIHGIPAAHLDYPDPTLRPFRDIDLLVPADAMAEATTALASAGLRRSASGATTRLVDDRGRRFELHADRALPGSGASVPPADLWMAPRSMVLAGQQIAVLADDARCVLACLRARSVGDRRLVVLRDVVQQILAGQRDLEGVVETAEQWRASAAVAETVDRAWHFFGLADVVGLSVWAARTRRSAEASAAARPAGRRRWQRGRGRSLGRRSRGAGR
jgi:hypothetical protein